MLKMARKLLQAEYEFVYLTMPTKMLGKVRLKKILFFSFIFSNTGQMNQYNGEL